MLSQRVDILQLMADAHKLDSSEEEKPEGTDMSSSVKKVALTREELMANVSK